MEIRDANAGDASALAAIYNHYIRDTAITFEEDPVSDEEMASRIAAVQDAGLPWLVFSAGGKLVGYAYATKWRARHAYRFSVESTVYLFHDDFGRGFGSALYRSLIERLTETGYHLVIGGIALPNDQSIALHEKLGFEKVAHFSEAGFKFGRWIDVGYWQLKLVPE